MSTPNSPDASNTITQKKRERDAPTDVTFEVDVDERPKSPERPATPRKKIREGDDTEANNESVGSPARTPCKLSSKGTSPTSTPKGSAIKSPSSVDPKTPIAANVPTSPKSVSPTPVPGKKEEQDESEKATTAKPTSPTPTPAKSASSIANAFRIEPTTLSGFGAISSSGMISFASLAASAGGKPLFGDVKSTSDNGDAAATVTVAKNNKDNDNDGDANGTGTDVAKDNNDDDDTKTKDTTDQPTSILRKPSESKLELAQVEVRTGEEVEETLFEGRVKLYEMENEQWKERGIGVLHLNVDSSKNIARLVMRRERTMQLILNSKLHQHTRPIQREATVIFAGTSLAGEPRTFLIKVKNIDIAKTLQEKMQENMPKA